MRDGGNNRKRINNIVFCGILTALAFAFSYLEMLVPSPVPGVPGIKLGLANLVVMYAMYCFSYRTAAAVSFLRILVSLVLFGNITSFIFSLCGAAVSLTAMVLVKKSEFFGITGVSVIGGVTHNIGQLFAAALIMGSSAVLYYLPVLLIAGALTGAFNGILLTLIHRKTEKAKPTVKAKKK